MDFASKIKRKEEEAHNFQNEAVISVRHSDISKRILITVIVEIQIKTSGK